MLFAVCAPICVWGHLLEANRGQFYSGIRFAAQNGNISTAITDSGIVFRGKHQEISLLAERPLASCLPTSPLQGETNYLARTPPLSHVPQYSSVTCRNVYPGIDWVFRSTGSSLEHDWNVAPGADPRKIALLLDGKTLAQITASGDLRLNSGGLAITWKVPESFQIERGVRQLVATHYRLNRRRITLELGRYRHDLPLVIDPVIDLSYVINGNGDDRGCQVAVDNSGGIYLAGLTLSGDFQTTPGAAYPVPVSSAGAYYQVFVRKLSPDGSQRIYSTYLGLASFDSPHPLGMRVDSSGNVYLAAVVFEQPTIAGTPIDPNGIVAVYKLSPAGDRLLYATRVLPGFNYGEAVALAIDNSGNAYVAAGSPQLQVSKIDPTGTKQVYLYTTAATESLTPGDIGVASDDTVYLAGSGSNLITTPGAMIANVSNPQETHGFVIHLTADGSNRIYSTYVANDDGDYVQALAIDASGSVYVGGQTFVFSKLPGLPGNLLGFSQRLPQQAFVMKVNAAGSAATYTALLPNDSTNAIAVDAEGNAYVAGSYGTTSLAASKIAPNGDKLLYFSSISAAVNSSTLTAGIAVDSSGAAYLTGSANSLRVPDQTTSTAILPNAFLLKIDPDPPQCDLWLEAPSGTTIPGMTNDFPFVIHNNGPADAENVVFSGPLQGGEIVQCRASGSGVCGTNPDAARVWFSSIPAGGSATVALQAVTDYSPLMNVVLQGQVSTLTSDLNLDNNSAAGTLVSSGVSVEIAADFEARYVVTLGTQAPTGGDTRLSSFLYAAPNTQVQVYWPSPQVSPLGTLTFQGWQDGSTENPRTFTTSTADLLVNGNFWFLNTPYFTPANITSAGSYAANAVSPGELISLFGFNLGAPGTAQVQNGRFPTVLANTSLTFDGVPAPLIYNNSLQLNAIVPYEIAGKSSTNITLQAGSMSYSATVPVVAATPALFTADSSGAGQAAALNQDGTPNSPASPANPGDVIVLYGTGEGLISPLPADGTITSTSPPEPAPKLPVTVNIGGMPAEVIYAAAAPGLTAGVIQINARIPAAIPYSHHVPISWSAGNFVSQANVTIAIKDSPGPPFVYHVGPDDLSLSAISLTPARVAAESKSTTVTINGSGFTSAMTAMWNNQTRPTLFVNSSTLTVTLSGNDLEVAQLGSISVWDASQIAQLTQSAPLLVYLPLLNWDLLYDSARNVIYVAVAAEQLPQGASIASVDPETGRIESSYALDKEPTKLAISSDNHYLYVGLGDTVRRINLDSWTPEVDIPLGQNQYVVDTMVTLPGINNSLAVSFGQTGSSPFYQGTAIFDDAKMRPTLVTLFDGPGDLLGGPDTNTLYAAGGEGALYSLQVDQSGVKIASTVENLLITAGVYAGGLIYDNSGTAVDPVAMQVVAEYDNQGPIVPLPDLQKVLILGDIPPPGSAVLSLGPVLTLNDANTGLRAWSLPLPVTLSLDQGPMIRCGVSAFALRESQTYSSTPAPSIDLFHLYLGN